MNKPAPKEPSMDEILSSIRQIIADDDAAGAPRRPSIQAAPPPMQAAPVNSLADSIDRDLNDMLDDIEPLALSSAQIVGGRDDDAPGGFSFDSILADTEADAPMAAPQLVEVDDIAFAPAEPVEEEEELPAFDPAPMVMREAEPVVEPEPEPAPRAAAPIEAPQAEERPAVAVSQAAPLPDPTLTTDLTNQLIGPATEAAVRSSITRLNGLGLGTPGATIESLMRDMLRPMLKEWLDENLPAVVERMVEKEITRISRGVE